MFKIAIVGRPNVGKSSLFNLLINARKAITDKIPNTTVDRLYGQATWLGKTFQVIDTGGIEQDATLFKNAIKEQVAYAINEANLIIMLTDINTLTNDDEIIAKYLKKSQKPVVLVLNKADNINLTYNQYEFYRLGFKDLFILSTKHKIGLGPLLDFIVTKMQLIPNRQNNQVIKFAIVGRPNVGKSSLANLILGANRCIVSPHEGTTLDAVNAQFNYHNRAFEVIDTAGLIRRGKEVCDKEKYAQLRALGALDECDIALMVLDINDGIKELDKNIAGYIKDRNKGIIIIANKWDLLIKDNQTFSKITSQIEEHFKMFQYAPVIPTSSLDKKYLAKIMDTIISVDSNINQQFKTSILNEVLARSVTINPPKPFNNGVCKFKYVTQIGTKPLKLLLFVNNPTYLHFTYLRYLENEFRQALTLIGAPLVLEVAKGE